MNNKLINLTAILFFMTLLVYILYVGSSILLPFIVAVVIWYIIIAIAEVYKKIGYKKYNMPNLVAVILSLITTYLVLNYIFVLIVSSIYHIVQDSSLYQEKLQMLIHYISQKTGTQFNTATILAKVNFQSIFTSVTFAITALAQNLALILIYVLFLLLEYHTFPIKLKAIFKSQERLEQARSLLTDIKASVNNYIKLKTIISFVTAFLAYIVLILFHVKNAEFWAILIFLLNYIPTIGSIVAIALTLLAVSIQFTSFAYFLLLAAGLISVQFIMGNIVEPKFTGSQLNLSPVVILLSLAIWGAIWGILGMFLCVPIMTIISIILRRFDSTWPVSILLSASPAEEELS